MEGLASDKLNKGKILYLIFITITLFVAAFFATNVEGVLSKSLIYWLLGITGLIAWVIGRTITMTKDIDIDYPDPIIYEEETLFGKLPYWMELLTFASMLIVGGFIFFNVAQSPIFQIVASPTFQVLELTPELSAFLSAAAAVIEDLVFFGLTPVIIFIVVKYFTKSKTIGLGVAWLVTPLIFTLYHIARYGFEMPVAMDKVLFFGFLSTSIVLITRKLILVDIIHIANNASIELFREVRLANIMMWFYIYLAVVAIIILTLYFRRKAIGGVGIR